MFNFCLEIHGRIDASKRNVTHAAAVPAHPQNFSAAKLRPRHHPVTLATAVNSTAHGRNQGLAYRQGQPPPGGCLHAHGSNQAADCFRSSRPRAGGGVKEDPGSGGGFCGRFVPRVAAGEMRRDSTCRATLRLHRGCHFLGALA